MIIFKRCNCPDHKACDHPYAYRFELHGTQVRRTTGTADFRKAERIARKAYGEMLDDAAGIKKPAPPQTFSKHVENYLKHTKTANVTAYKDKAVLDRLMTFVGAGTVLTKIGPFDIERWKSARAAEVAKSTVNRELNIVRGCLARAVEWKLLATSPADAVQAYKVDDQRIRVFSEDELRTILAMDDGFSDGAADAGFVVTICRVTLITLARISEVRTMHKSHIGPNWIERRLKGGKVQRIPAPADLCQKLRERAHEESGLVFGEGALGYAPTQQTASQRVFRAFRAAGIEDASHHTARHTGVTLMLERGVSPRVIQQLAGWSSLRMLERYGHARDAEAQRAVGAMSELLTTLEGAT